MTILPISSIPTYISKMTNFPYLTVGNNIPVDTGPFYEKLKAAKPFVALF
jgi:hypothetical protein